MLAKGRESTTSDHHLSLNPWHRTLWKRSTIETERPLTIIDDTRNDSPTNTDCTTTKRLRPPPNSWTPGPTGKSEAPPGPGVKSHTRTTRARNPWKVWKIQPYHLYPWQSPEANIERPTDATLPNNMNQIIPLKEVAPKKALVAHLLLADYPKGWKASGLTTYNGTGDPDDQIHGFIIEMEDMMTRKGIWCRMFRRTLTEDVVGWYRSLPPRSIRTCEELERTFRVAFSHRICEQHDSNNLLNVYQGERETLREYLACFAITAQSVEDS